LHGVEAGHNLRHELSDDDNDDTGKETGLQEDSLDPVGDIEQESRLGLAVDGGELGSEEHQTHHEHLPAHQELLDVVALTCLLTKLEGGGVLVLVGVRVLTLELHQGDLEALHHPQKPQHEDEDEQARPARHRLPHARLLFQDCVACHNPGEHQQS